ncbi:hypothetical protein RUND412_007854 [Rhizina undulata]
MSSVNEINASKFRHAPNSTISSNEGTLPLLVDKGYGMEYVSQVMSTLHDEAEVEFASEREARIGLQGLCSELLLLIFSRLQTPELSAAARTCILFYELCVPLMYRVINLHIGQRISGSLANQYSLQPLRKFNEAISRSTLFYTKEIKISNRFDSGFLRNGISKQNETGLSKLFENLADASSLKTFIYNSSIHFSIPKLLILSALPSLKKVHITLESWFNQCSTELHSLQALSPKFNFELTLSTVFLSPSGVVNLIQLLPLFPNITELSMIMWGHGSRFLAPAMPRIKLRKLVVDGGFDYEDAIFSLVDFSQLEELVLATVTKLPAPRILIKLVQETNMCNLKKLWIRWDDCGEMEKQFAMELAAFVESLKGLEELGLQKPNNDIWKLKGLLKGKALKTLVVDRPVIWERYDDMVSGVDETFGIICESARNVEMLGIDLGVNQKNIPERLSNFPNLVAVRIRRSSRWTEEVMISIAEKIYIAVSSVHGSKQNLRYVGFGGRIFRVSRGVERAVNVQALESPEEIWSRDELKLWRNPLAVGEDSMAVEWRAKY